MSRPVPSTLLTRLRTLCLALPETVEEPAWVGTRWCIRKKNFAHVLMIFGGSPPAYAKAVGSGGPLCVMTFRSPLPAFDAYAYTWEPFFRPVWFPDIVGLKLDDRTDWDEVAALVRASYCHLAPKNLALQVADQKSV